MSEHSILSPSRFPHLVACPGSWKLERHFPNVDSVYSIEGKLAHDYAAFLLNSRKTFMEVKPINILSLTEEMIDAAHVYENHILEIADNVLDKVHVEERIDIPYLHKDCFGTPDAWYYDEAKNNLHVWDFKYGFKAVEVEGNWQLIGYAAGIVSSPVEKTSIKFDSLQKLIIVLHIVQPRSYHKDGIIRSWVLTYPALVEYVIKLESKILNSQSDNPEFNVGNHCKNCKARSICDEFRNKIRSITLNKTFKMGENALEFKNEEIESFDFEQKPISTNYASINKEGNISLASHKYISDAIVKANNEILYTKKYVDDICENMANDNEKIIQIVKDCGGDMDTCCKELEKSEVLSSITPAKAVDLRYTSLSEEITELRKNILLLQTRLHDLEKEAIGKLEKGENVEGYRIKSTFSRASWTISAEDVSKLGEGYGVKFCKPTRLEVITPLQAIKLLSKNEEAITNIKSLMKSTFKEYKLISVDEEDEDIDFDSI